MEKKIVLRIVIVNYKNALLTNECIRSIIRSNYQDYQIVVVDNSADGKHNINQLKYPKIDIIYNNYNEGFGRANNKGNNNNYSDYILFLNSDVKLFNDTLKSCISYMENKPDIGVLGCILLNEDGTLQKSTYSIASYRKQLNLNLIINKIFPNYQEGKEALMGSFMLIPRKVFEEVSGFDPDFFMYSEELDLCHRIAKKGYRIEYFEGASAIHKNGGSTANKKWSMKQRYLSNALLFLKVRGYGGYVLYHFLFLFNSITNFFCMWFIDQLWRKNYWKEQKYYFSNFGYYLLIPFIYSKKTGNGKRMLKRNS